MINVAFKEWVAVCRAIGAGVQSVILRKGGIAEAGGAFRPEHDRFWLYPTHFHEQQQVGIKSAYHAHLAEAVRDRPAAGSVRFTHYVDVTAVHHLTALDTVLWLDGLHIWTAETVTQRFHYRRPGLYVLVVRAFALPQPATVLEHPEYAGCKTWVELVASPAAAEAEAVPVIGETEWGEVLARIEAVVGRVG